MVGWFYINDEVAAPIRMLESDAQSGVVSIEVAARFVPRLTMLRGRTFVEYRHWAERRQVRCLAAECVGAALMIEAVEVGSDRNQAGESQSNDAGSPEDWLAIDGRAHCRVANLRASTRPLGHCIFDVGLTDWRDLRIGENAPLASLGINLGAGPDIDGSITPLLHAARQLPGDLAPPTVEIIRLRERQRLIIAPFATDWGDETTLVVARIEDTRTLQSRSPQTSVATP
ncbi:MAG: hypothetical protein ACPGYV_02770 [Phycisphaeraceae bacterium]